MAQQGAGAPTGFEYEIILGALLVGNWIHEGNREALKREYWVALQVNEMKLYNSLFRIFHMTY